MLSSLRNLLLLLALLLGLVFGFFNLEPVRLNFLAGEVQWPLVAALGFSLLVGFLLGLSSLVPTLLRMRTELALQRRRTAGAEAELKNLRNLPLAEP